MEAKKFGFSLDASPAFKFDPTEADIVAHYLLPRALGIPNPHAHAIIDDDPRSLPPWDLLVKHGHAAGGDQSVHAFFFGPPTDASKNGGRKGRTVKGGGTWQGQKGADETITLLRPGGGEVDIVYKRYNLTFKHLGRSPAAPCSPASSSRARRTPRRRSWMHNRPCYISQTQSKQAPATNTMPPAASNLLARKMATMLLELLSGTTSRWASTTATTIRRKLMFSMAAQQWRRPAPAMILQTNIRPKMATAMLLQSTTTTTTTPTR
jgi:hypothetical protein